MLRQLKISKIITLFIFFACCFIFSFLRTEGKGGDKPTGYS